MFINYKLEDTEAQALYQKMLKKRSWFDYITYGVVKTPLLIIGALLGAVAAILFFTLGGWIPSVAIVVGGCLIYGLMLLHERTRVARAKESAVAVTNYTKDLLQAKLVLSDTQQELEQRVQHISEQSLKIDFQCAILNDEVHKLKRHTASMLVKAPVPRLSFFEAAAERDEDDIEIEANEELIRKLSKK